jgi:hypothetical protein
MEELNKICKIYPRAGSIAMVEENVRYVLMRTYLSGHCVLALRPVSSAWRPLNGTMTFVYPKSFQTTCNVLSTHPSSLPTQQKYERHFFCRHERTWYAISPFQPLAHLSCSCRATVTTRRNNLIAQSPTPQHKSHHNARRGKILVRPIRRSAM